MEQRIEGARPAAHDDRAVAAQQAPLSESDLESVKEAILAKLTLAVGRSPVNATDRDWFVATALTVRDRTVHAWMECNRQSRIENRKKVYYLSLEFLIGRMLREVLHNFGITELY